jgi:hypothetical protein
MIISSSLLILAIALVSFNLYGLQVAEAWTNPFFIYPWYLVITYFGISIPIIFGTFLSVFKRYSNLALSLIYCSLTAIFVLVVVFYFAYIPGLPAPSSTVNRYLLFMVFPLSCLAALGICSLFDKNESDSTQNDEKNN